MKGGEEGRTEGRKEDGWMNRVYSPIHLQTYLDPRSSESAAISLAF
jgi:hypothetical protein